MSAADFLLAPEVQKLLRVAYAAPGQRFPTSELAQRAKLDADDVSRTLEHLVKSGILKWNKPKSDLPATVEVDRSFVFHDELRSIALKSFAAAEPIRAMLRSRFKESVLRAFVLEEDEDASVEVLIVHGQLMPDEAEMTTACEKLSKTIGRHLEVHVISNARFGRLTSRDALTAKLAADSAHEIVALGDTKAKLPVERAGLIQSAARKLATLYGPTA
ncbi:hypothetical protein [Variovorax sp. dw_954]|uniref:hypothetical protein n=1 Tax=Variovorax sp. dw_954 TaxID=2720078 RepID=UPI001BD21C39|nr:hypothetical protein [Variovorax sp. dw_954]